MNATTDWDDIRIQASILILAGICSSTPNRLPHKGLVRSAVETADFLIDILKKQDRPQ